MTYGYTEKEDPVDRKKAGEAGEGENNLLTLISIKGQDVVHKGTV